MPASSWAPLLSLQILWGPALPIGGDRRWPRPSSSLGACLLAHVFFALGLAINLTLRATRAGDSWLTTQRHTRTIFTTRPSPLSCVAWAPLSNQDATQDKLFLQNQLSPRSAR